jgi:hypothetical protein
MRAAKPDRASPIAHPIFVDFTFEDDRAAGKNRRKNGHVAKPNLALPCGLIAELEEPAVAIEHVGAAACHVRRDVVGLNEAFVRALELTRPKAGFENDLASDAFQGCLLG